MLYLLLLKRFSQWQLLHSVENKFIQVIEVVLLAPSYLGLVLTLTAWCLDLHWALVRCDTVSITRKSQCVLTLGPVLTYQSLSSLDQKAPVYLVILLVFMIVDITRSVVAVLHSSSVRSYKYPDHLPDWSLVTPACVVKDDGWEGGDVVHIVHSPEPRVVRPQ